VVLLQRALFSLCGNHPDGYGHGLAINLEAFEAVRFLISQSLGIDSRI